jgi:hypothetical protein
MLIETRNGVFTYFYIKLVTPDEITIDLIIKLRDGLRGMTIKYPYLLRHFKII